MVSARLAGLNRVRTVEGLAASGDLFEHRCRREPRAELLFELAQAPEHLLGADRVDEAEGAAAKRGEAEPEHRADVTVARAPKMPSPKQRQASFTNCSAQRQAMSSFVMLLLLGVTPSTS